jgi:hypothetical protein
MKKVFIIFLTLLTSLAMGQNNFMSLGFGSLIPQGNYAASSDLTRNGFAYNGFTGDYSGAWFKKTPLGLGGNIRFSSNSINEQTAADLLRADIPDIIPDTSTPEIIVGYWKQVSMTVGPVITLSSDHFNFDMYTLGGINFTMPPQMQINVGSNNTKYSETLNPKTVHYALELGIALRIHLSEKTSFRLFADYFQSVAKGTIDSITTQEQEELFENKKYNCPIHSLNAGIGLAYRL